MLELAGKTLVWAGGGWVQRCGYCHRDFKPGDRYEIQWVNRDVHIEEFRGFHLDGECFEATVLPFVAKP